MGWKSTSLNSLASLSKSIPATELWLATLVSCSYTYASYSASSVRLIQSVTSSFWLLVSLSSKINNSSPDSISASRPGSSKYSSKSSEDYFFSLERNSEFIEQLLLLVEDIVGLTWYFLPCFFAENMFCVGFPYRDILCCELIKPSRDIIIAACCISTLHIDSLMI